MLFRRSFSLALLTLAFCVGVLTAAPRIEVVGGTTFDLGTVPARSVQKGTFLITNTGDDTLKITAVRPSCGCITGVIDRTTLLPGDTARLLVTYATQHGPGPAMKTISVQSNDSANPSVILRVRCINVHDLMPSRWSYNGLLLQLDSTGGRGEWSGSITLVNTGPDTLSIGRPRPLEQRRFLITKTIVPPGRLAPRDSITITVYAKEQSHMQGHPYSAGYDQYTTLTIPTSGRFDPEVVVSIVPDRRNR